MSGICRRQKISSWKTLKVIETEVFEWKIIQQCILSAGKVKLFRTKIWTQLLSSGITRALKMHICSSQQICNAKLAWHGQILGNETLTTILKIIFPLRFVFRKKMIGRKILTLVEVKETQSSKLQWSKTFEVKTEIRTGTPTASKLCCPTHLFDWNFWQVPTNT